MGGVAHGMSREPVYKSWHMMMQRCTNYNNPKWPQYGGRGIKVKDGWWNFKKFYADMGPRPPGTTLGRIDNNGDYCKANCEWQSSKTQAANKTTTVWITQDGITDTLEGWSRRLGIPLNTLRIRRKRRPGDTKYLLNTHHKRQKRACPTLT